MLGVYPELSRSSKPMSLNPNLGRFHHHIKNIRNSQRWQNSVTASATGRKVRTNSTDYEDDRVPAGGSSRHL